MKIHKGDTVKIMVGKDAGKTGKIIKVDQKTGTVLVDGINIFKRHTRPKRQGEKGQIVTLPGALNMSKIMLFCPNCKKPVRVGHRIEADGQRKTRICKKCKATI